MTRAGPDHDAGTRIDIELFVVELHFCTRFAFKKVIGFGELLVVVESIVQFNLGNMDGTWKIGDVGKGPASGSTRARYAWQSLEVDEFIRFRCHRAVNPLKIGQIRIVLGRDEQRTVYQRPFADRRDGSKRAPEAFRLE